MKFICFHINLNKSSNKQQHHQEQEQQEQREEQTDAGKQINVKSV